MGRPRLRKVSLPLIDSLLVCCTNYVLMRGLPEFHGMDNEAMLKSLNVLVKRGKAQVFGSEGSEGVKFF